MTAKYNGPNDRIKKSDGRQARMAQEEEITLKGNFEQRRSGWRYGEIKHLALNAGVLIALKQCAPFGLPKKKKDGRDSGIFPKPERKGKGR